MASTDKAKTAVTWFIAIAIMLTIYKILQKIGIIKTSKELEQEGAAYALQSDKYISDLFSGNNRVKFAAEALKMGKLPFLGVPQNGYLAEVYAKQIWDAKGTFKDNEDSVYNVFRDINDQYSIPFVAYKFSELFQRDLLGFLPTFMDNDELAIVYNIIKNNPKASVKNTFVKTK